MKFLKGSVFPFYHLRHKCDVAVIGGGIVGTAIARKIKLENPKLETYLIEKECGLGEHQTSHNSGVMHSGVYYKPDSFKARFCWNGLDLLKKYCDRNGIQYRKSGKLIVAKRCEEVNTLRELLKRGEKNNVQDLQLLTSLQEIRTKASGCRGVAALWCPHTANVDFKEITTHLAKDFLDSGGVILLNWKVSTLKRCLDCAYNVEVIPERNDRNVILAKYVITCAGLHSEAFCSETSEKLVSFKVNYQMIDAKYCDDLGTNIYPVPDLCLPFLGSHFSPLRDNTILLGPVAVPALKIEGYTNEEVNLCYLSKIATSKSFGNMVIRNWTKCVEQAAKFMCTDVQIKEMQQLMPNLSYQFIRKGPSAVQCQLLDVNGNFRDDFIVDVFQGDCIGQWIINVKFTPSPAATSCLSIADYVVKELMNKVCCLTE